MVVPVSGSLNWQLMNSNWLIVELLFVGPISNISTGSSAASASALALSLVALAIGSWQSAALLLSYRTFEWFFKFQISKPLKAQTGRCIAPLLPTQWP